MLEGKKLIQIGGVSFLLALAIGVLSLQLFPVNSIGYVIGGLVSLTFLLLFIPLIMWGFLKREQEKPSSIFKNKVYFWASLVGLLSIGVAFLIVTTLVILYSSYPHLFFLPLYFSVVYIAFAIVFLKYKKLSK